MFLSLVTLILLLLCFELILRAGGYFYFYVYSNLDRPNIEEDAFRILFLGESTTAGGLVGKDNAYPAQVQRILQDHYPTIKISSNNRGVGSIETTAILRNLDRNIINYKPHLIILMAGRNDNFLRSEQISWIKRVYLNLRVYQLVSSIIDLSKVYPIDENGFFRYGYNISADYKRSRPVSEFVFNP